MIGSAAIVTIVDFNNFGNRLQNFALQEMVRRAGVAEVRTIVNSPQLHDAFGNGSYLRLKAERIGLWMTALQIARSLRRSSADAGELSRIENAVIPVRMFEGSLEQASSQFDAFIVGSDQVWNPLYRFASPVDFLSFAPPGRRIAYAASFGHASLPSWLRDTYASGLTGIDAISVREPEGALIVRELTGREVPVVLDPTLLAGPEMWHSLVPPKAGPAAGAGLVFGVGLSSQDQNVAEESTRARGLAVQHLPPGSGLSPLALVEGISAAAFVATNSFHAFAFAVMYRKPVLVLPREGMGGRFEAVLDVMGVDKTACRAGRPFLVEPCDWEELEARLEPARAASWHFLITALGAVQ
ncbi:hypothetical protein BN13_140008 [Nostocoides jenkinsii Ben 74]|uniref:Polysaccharide pyruvyl transferase domain-containing protein n=1 Tax=Nostocoides jenkinsii Ben 74 TaxID=1193518 RepID=A0A077M476_9MICO|nr:hypothetical protein BN13_140008 [Tetrasphaera jenkinsii Ben 74]